MAVVVLFAVLGGCASDPPVEQGYVRHREFLPAHWEGGWRTEWEMAYRCHTGMSADGKSTTTTCGPEMVPVDVWEDHHRWIDDRWRLRLQDCTTNDDGKTKCREGWRYVTAAEYDRFPVGRHYPDPR